MFSRLFGSDSRGCDKTAESLHMPSTTKTCPLTPQPPQDRPLKRRRSSTNGHVIPAVVTPIPPPTKRLKVASSNGVPVVAAAAAVAPKQEPKDELNERLTEQIADKPKQKVKAKGAQDALSADKLEAAKEAIEFEFSLEIRKKHDELRFIEQEIAKCQVAYEQLRRCHLIPYPTACPTPEQMLDIASGKGASVRPRPGESAPKWGAPFGVVDGPYSRHYAKWLIPDPVFDGVRQDMQVAPQATQVRNSAEGRTTRNSFADPSTIKPRSGRGSVGQKLHALSSGYPQPKEKAGPCILKRANGVTVKLVCINCHRDNFSSTQGFINHCRIAHKIEFKSHEEAAAKCGHPIDVDAATTGPVSEEKPALPAPAVAAVPVPPPSSATGLVHPLARTDKEVADVLLSRVKLALKGMKSKSSTGKGGRKMSASAGVRKNSTKLVPSAKTPFLTKMMQQRKVGGNLKEQVEEATAPAPIFEDVLMSSDDESEDSSQNVGSTPSEKPTFTSAVGGVRTPAVSRAPVRPTTATPAPLATGMPPLSTKGRSPHLSFATPSAVPALDLVGKHEISAGLYGGDDMDTEDLSPNTATSNNAPSLVSDDGEYDDSDEGSSTENSDSEVESVSDVAEINLEEDELAADRTARYHRGSTGAAAVKLKEKEKPVTFVSPVRNGKARRN